MSNQNLYQTFIEHHTNLYHKPIEWDGEKREEWVDDNNIMPTDLTGDIVLIQFDGNDVILYLSIGKRLTITPNPDDIYFKCWEYVLSAPTITEINDRLYDVQYRYYKLDLPVRYASVSALNKYIENDETLAERMGWND